MLLELLFLFSCLSEFVLKTPVSFCLESAFSDRAFKRIIKDFVLVLSCVPARESSLVLGLLLLSLFDFHCLSSFEFLLEFDDSLLRFKYSYVFQNL
jgi:hypothetical protein